MFGIGLGRSIGGISKHFLQQKNAVCNYAVILPELQKGFQAVTIEETMKSKFGEFVTIEPSMTIQDVLLKMRDEKLSCLIIKTKDERKPLGMFTERDYIMKCEGKNAPERELPISRVTNGGIIPIYNNYNVFQCLALMSTYSIRHLPAYEWKGQQLVDPSSESDLVSMATGQDVMKLVRDYINAPADDEEEVKAREIFSTTIAELMENLKTPQDVSVEADTTCDLVVAKMNANNMGAVVVQNGDELAGIITEKDFLYKIGADEKRPKKIAASEIMTSKVKVINSTDTLKTAVEAINDIEKRHLVVKKEEGFTLLSMVDINKYIGDRIRNRYDFDDKKKKKKKQESSESDTDEDEAKGKGKKGGRKTPAKKMTKKAKAEEAERLAKEKEEGGEEGEKEGEKEESK